MLSRKTRTSHLEVMRPDHGVDVSNVLITIWEHAHIKVHRTYWKFFSKNIDRVFFWKKLAIYLTSFFIADLYEISHGNSKSAVGLKNFVPEVMRFVTSSEIYEYRMSGQNELNDLDNSIYVWNQHQCWFQIQSWSQTIVEKVSCSMTSLFLKPS